MNDLKMLEEEIEKMRKDLNYASQNQLPNHIPDENILMLSRKMDELLNEYQKEYYSF